MGKYLKNLQPVYRKIQYHEKMSPVHNTGKSDYKTVSRILGQRCPENDSRLIYISQF